MAKRKHNLQDSTSQHTQNFGPSNPEEIERQRECDKQLKLWLKEEKHIRNRLGLPHIIVIYLEDKDADSIRRLLYDRRHSKVLSDTLFTRVQHS